MALQEVIGFLQSTQGKGDTMISTYCQHTLRLDESEVMDLYAADGSAGAVMSSVRLRHLRALDELLDERMHGDGLAKYVTTSIVGFVQHVMLGSYALCSALEKHVARVRVLCSVDPRYCANLPPEQEREARSGASAIQAAGGAAYLLLCIEQKTIFVAFF